MRRERGELSVDLGILENAPVERAARDRVVAVDEVVQVAEGKVVYQLFALFL